MTLLINLFSFSAIVSAIMVLLSRNPLHSVLFLVMSFLSVSVLLFLLENEFLALFFLIIYLGAIAVLFLFVVMMLDIKYKDLQISKFYLPLGILIGFVLLTETLSSLFTTFIWDSSIRQSELFNLYNNWYDHLDSLPDVNAVGQIFYTHYILQILMTGLILYVAVIGVAFLTINSASKHLKRDQILFRQLSRTKVL